MKIGTQNQAFFPENILEKFRYIKEMGFDGFEIDGKLLVNNIEEVKAAIKETGLPVTTACGGYDGWIGDFIVTCRRGTDGNGVLVSCELAESVFQLLIFRTRGYPP